MRRPPSRGPVRFFTLEPALHLGGTPQKCVLGTPSRVPSKSLRLCTFFLCAAASLHVESLSLLPSPRPQGPQVLSSRLHAGLPFLGKCLSSSWVWFCSKNMKVRKSVPILGEFVVYCPNFYPTPKAGGRERCSYVGTVGWRGVASLLLCAWAPSVPFQSSGSMLRFSVLASLVSLAFS